VPIYEYRCPNGHTFELFQRMSDPPVSACDVCGASPVEKVLYPVAVHFKGKGFYATDYGRGSRAAKEGEGGSSAGKESSSGGDGSTGSGEKKSTGGSEGGATGKKADSS
jgi:putative FmdB family regulatory protein